MFEFQRFPPQTGIIKTIIPMTCQTNSTQRNRFVAGKMKKKTCSRPRRTLVFDSTCTVFLIPKQ